MIFRLKKKKQEIVKYTLNKKYSRIDGISFKAKKIQETIKCTLNKKYKLKKKKHCRIDGISFKTKKIGNY